MPNAIIHINLLFQTISYTTRHKSTGPELLAAIYPTLSARSLATAMEADDFSAVVGAQIPAGSHGIVQKNV